MLIVATTPRVVLGVTRPLRAHDPAEPLTADPDHTLLFEHGLSVNAVENRLGYRLRGGSVHEGSYANGIVGVLNVELDDPHPWFTPATAPDDNTLPSIAEVWHADSTSIVGRNDLQGGGFSTRVVLYGPAEPHQMITTLATIVTDTFDGDLDAALRVLIDDHECWELLHPATGIETASCRVLRGHDMPPQITATAVPGVGIALNGVSHPDGPDHSRIGDEAHGEAAWGYFFDPDGSITVLQTADDHGNPVWQPWAVYTPDETGLRRNS
ncbi:hypothetical protein ACWEQV_20930 [Rhodococcus aetherivorans]